MGPILTAAAGPAEHHHARWDDLTLLRDSGWKTASTTAAIAAMAGPAGISDDARAFASAGCPPHPCFAKV